MNLTDPQELREFLKRNGLSANKGLGQHFLCSAKVVEGIVRRCMGCASVLEIGPGPGVLTSPLSVFGPLIALEVDERMIAALSESAPSADVRRVDALKADLPALLAELPSPRALVSNMPYYITGPLLGVIGDASAHFSKAVLMMQKEVGQRVLAPTGSSDRGSLSVYLQGKFVISKVCDAPRGAFLPPPKVDSIVLEFVPVADPPPEELFAFVRKCFFQPRKTLANNMMMGLKIPREQAETAILSAGLSPKTRPQELALSDWAALRKSL